MIFNVLLKKFQKNTIFLLIFFLFFTAETLQAETLDRVVAVINDDVITLSELNEFGNEFLQKAEETAPEAEREEALKTIREQLLEQLINQHLITQQAKIAGVKLSDGDVESAYQRQLESMKLTRAEFLDKLREAGLSEETYKTNLRNQVLRDKLILYEVRSKIIVTDEMINDYYNSRYAAEGSGNAYYLLQIGFTWGKTEEIQNSKDLLDADKARAMQKAYQIHERVEEGEDFATLAREYSDLPTADDGGDLGLLHVEDMADYMKKAVMKLEPGQITPVIETPIGYQFFKLLSSKNGDIVNQVPLFEVKEEIRQKLFEEEFKKEYAEWVDMIRKRSYIKKML